MSKYTSIIFTMKVYLISTLVGALMLLSIGFKSASIPRKIANDTISAKALKLKELYSICTSSPELRRIYQKRFFNEFPTTFKQFNELYGYSEITGKGNVLYLVSYDHVDIFFKNLDMVNDTIFYNKIVKIAIGGKWDADAVNYFQHDLRTIVESNIALTINILETMDKKDVFSFWFFYFDGIHPQKEIGESLQRVKLIDDKIYNIMVEAHQEVLKQSE